MNCPNCGNEINENQKFCMFCGANLSNVKKTEEKTQQTKNKIKDVIKSKHFIISFIIIFIIFICALIPFCSSMISKDTYTCKSITPITKQEMDKMSARSALELLIQQDNYLKKYKNKHPNENLTKLFEIFYRNLILYTGTDSDMDSKFSFDADKYVNENDTKGTFIVDDIEIQFIKSKNEYNYYDFSFNIINPKSNLIKLELVEDNIWNAHINHDYLIKCYSNVLNKDINAYLKVNREWCLFTFFDDLKIIIDYPNISLKDIIEIDLKEYMEYYFRNYEEEYWESSEQDRKLYEKFLTIKNNDNEMYQKIKEWYEIMIKDNFKAGINYYQYMYNLTGSEYYKEELNKKLNSDEERIKRELEKEKQDAEIFAQYIKKIVKAKDIETFANYINYPIKILDENIKNRDEFIALGIDKIFPDEFVKQVTEHELFSNYKGYMLGYGPNLWFDTFDGEMKITTLNY